MDVFNVKNDAEAVVISESQGHNSVGKKNQNVRDMVGNAGSTARSLAGNLAQADAAEKKHISEATSSFQKLPFLDCSNTMCTQLKVCYEFVI